jgi:DNA invertase Pin-like site-specific DNA recombinase
MEKIKVFAYLRVSDPSQVKGDGYTRQLKAIREYAEAHDFEVTDVYREAFTGTELDRPVLAKLMDSLEQNHHGVTTVIIERLDRLAREYFVQEAIIRDFQRGGYTLISANAEEYDLASADPTRVLVRTVLGAIAEYEKSMLVAKLRAARERIRRSTGKCAGPKAYRELPEYVELINHIRTLYSVPGATLKVVADQLNLEGSVTMKGRPWTLVGVQQILRPTDQRPRHQLKRDLKKRNHNGSKK